MSEEKTGGPAFPGIQSVGFIPSDAPEIVKQWVRDSKMPMNGMTLWDYYYGQCALGIISGLTQVNEIGIIKNQPQDVAEIAATYANCMITERSRRGAE